MKKNLLTLAVILTVGFFTNDANAQANNTASATAGAKLIKPITLKKTADLNFGTINVGAGAAGTVTLSTAAANTYSAGLAAGVISGAPVVSNAAYDVTGTKNLTYTVTLPANNTVTVTETGGTTDKMTINNFTVLINSAATGKIGTLSGTGADTFKVGATLVVGLNQPTGIYTGSFDVSVDYN